MPQRYLLISAFVSYCILAVSYLQGVPAWLGFGLALFPWVLMVFVEVRGVTCVDLRGLKTAIPATNPAEEKKVQHD